MKRNGSSNSLAAGALAGLAGTAVIQGMQAITQKTMPDTLPPLKQDPGEFMVHHAENALPASSRERIPEPLEHAAARALAFGYGTTFGALYGTLAPRERRVVTDGVLLGTAAWAAGYLGWLPALDLTPPVWRQKPRQVIPNILSHAVFGVVTTGLFALLRRRI